MFLYRNLQFSFLSKWNQEPIYGAHLNVHLLLDAQNVEKQIESYFAFKDFESKNI